MQLAVYPHVQAFGYADEKQQVTLWSSSDNLSVAAQEGDWLSHRRSRLEFFGSAVLVHVGDSGFVISIKQFLSSVFLDQWNIDIL